MSSSFDQFQKRKLISSYFSVVISIALVLFLLGCLGLLVLNAKTISDNFKEQVVVSIYLNESAKDVEVKQLEKSLAMAEYTKSSEYVSKEEAAELMKAEYGEDFLDNVGQNPLQNSIDVYLKADYVTSETLSKITEELSQKDFVQEVRYDSDLVELMNNNVKKITFWVLIISALFTLIAVLFILGIMYVQKWYTGLTFILTALFLLLLVIRVKPRWLGRFYLAYLVSLIPFLLVNGILTGSFIPDQIVWYNNAENLSIRIFTIPVEDSIYMMLLLLMSISVYEHWKEKNNMTTF